MKHLSKKVVSILRNVVTLLIAGLIITGCKKTIVNNYITNPAGNYGTGLVTLPAATYAAIPVASAPPTGGGSVPSSYFLDIPTVPFNQGNQGSCASCAAAMGKSILDHVKNNAAYPSGGIIYSPSYLYHQTRLNPNDCITGGSTLLGNFEIMKTQGVCKLSDMPYGDDECNSQPSANQKLLAANNKISNYKRLPDPLTAADIKAHILSGSPVIVAFVCSTPYWGAPFYFNTSNPNEVWTSQGQSMGSAHATLLYGWDDSKNAFRMLNQWGPGFGSNGSIWVAYSLVANRNVFFEAYVIENGSTPASNNLQVTGDLSFGSVAVNSSSTRALQLANNGTNTINVSSISVSSPFSSNWSGGAIPAGTTKNVSVIFTPTSAGAASSPFTINSDASNNTITLQATGTGTQTSSTRIISLSGNLAFGNVTAGQTSSRTLTISNTGNGPLTITSIIAPPGYSCSYSGTIQPGASVNITVTFSPSSAQSYPGTVTVNSDATSGAGTIAVSGTGISAAPVVVPPVGSYPVCDAVASYFCPPNVNYGTGVISGRVVSINTATHQITIEIKKCDGSAFNAGGHFNIVSGLCSGLSYSFTQFFAGQTSVQATFTDNNMTGTKTYWPFIVQGTANIQYTAPVIMVTY